MTGCRPCRGSDQFFNLPGAWGFASRIRSLATPSRVERYRALTPGYYSCTPPGRKDSFACGSPTARQTSILCFAKAIFFIDAAIKDEEVELTEKSHKHYPRSFRHVSAKVLGSNGKEITVSFLSNNVDRAASSICDLYRCRWGIEAFFKEINQTLQIRTFVGFSRNAIGWQIWCALLTYLLMSLWPS